MEHRLLLVHAWVSVQLRIMCIVEEVLVFCTDVVHLLVVLLKVLACTELLWCVSVEFWKQTRMHGYLICGMRQGGKEKRIRNSVNICDATLLLSQNHMADLGQGHSWLSVHWSPQFLWPGEDWHLPQVHYTPQFSPSYFTGTSCPARCHCRAHPNPLYSCPQWQQNQIQAHLILFSSVPDKLIHTSSSV